MTTGTSNKGTGTAGNKGAAGTGKTGNAAGNKPPAAPKVPATPAPDATPAPTVEPEVLTLKLLPIVVSSVPPAYTAEVEKLQKREARMVRDAMEDGDDEATAREYAAAMTSAAIAKAAERFKISVDSPDSYLGSRPDVVLELRKIRALATELRLRMNKMGDLLGTSGWRLDNLKIDMDSSKPVTLTQRKGNGTGERASPDTLEPRELYEYIGKRSTLIIKYDGVEYSADSNKDAVVDRISKKSHSSFHSWQKEVLALIETTTGKTKVHAPSAYDFIKVSANGEIKKLSEYRKLIRDAAKTTEAAE